MKLLNRSSGFGILFVVSLLVGCHGIQTDGEKDARRQIQSVAATFRPRDQKPALPDLGPEMSLSNFLAFAMLNQPKVEGAYYDWAASVERITVTRSLPDPQLTFQADIANLVSSVMPGVMMNFPGPGKLRAAAAVASAESQAKYFTFRSVVLESALEVKRSYYQLYSLAEKIRVNRETLRLLSDLEQLARSQNEVGKVTLQDVLRAQIEQEKLKNDLANLEDSRSVLTAQFKAALGLTATDPTPALPLQFESTPLDLGADEVLSAALTNNLRLKSLALEIRAAEANIALARKSKIPDSSLGFMGDVKASPVFYRPTATLSLPIWRDKISAQIAEAQANKRSAEARLSAEQISLVADVATRTYQLRETSRNLELFRNQLVPKARQSLEVARSGYLAGQIDFFNLTDSERTLLNFELERVEASTQREIALAELSLIVAGLPPVGEISGSSVMNRGSPTAGKRSSPGANNSMR
jgi:outer membrane protein, heavy metal efflux system